MIDIILWIRSSRCRKVPVGIPVLFGVVMVSEMLRGVVIIVKCVEDCYCTQMPLGFFLPFNVEML